MFPLYHCTRIPNAHIHSVIFCCLEFDPGELVMRCNAVNKNTHTHTRANQIDESAPKSPKENDKLTLQWKKDIESRAK